MFRNESLICAVIGAAALLALPASATSTDGCDGPGGAIPPTGTGGTDPTTNTFVSSFVVPTGGEIVGISVTLNELVHTWIGDLHARITHEETGTTVDLFNRIGMLGGAGFGDSSNFNGTYQFHDSYIGDMWNVASILNTSGIIPSGMYFPTTTDGAVSLLSAFHGEDAAGTWTLRITDYQSSDAGSIHCWGLTLLTRDIPAPGAIALLGIAGLKCTRRRRN